MNIKEREEELFHRWRTEQGYDGFIKDGVFDETVWREQELKITFVLKEPNWPGGDGDIRENLVKWPNRNHWRTWNNIARWTKALLEGGSYPERVSREERNEWLRRVSFLNLKKAGGGSHANPDTLRACAHADARYIREQLLLYKPDIIICCGKWIVANVLENEVLKRPDLPGPVLPVQDWEDWDHTPCFYTRFPEKERLTPVVSFRHPQQRRTGHSQWRDWFGQMKEARAVLLPPEL